MRAGPNAIPAILILPALMLATAPAEARRDPGRPHHRAASGTDTGRTLARLAARDRHRDWQVWQAPRPLAQYLAPATRERVAAPPFTGWGYGGTIPGAWPGY